MNRRTLVSFDWALKRLLRNKANFNILSGFLSELLFDDICVEEILESEGNQDSDRDKFNRLDLLCPNQRNEFIIIEVQYHDESDYFHRCLYGTSKVITEYINKGEPYHQVKKVYSVNILYFDLGHGDDYIYVGKTKFTGLHNKSNLTLSPTQQKKFDKSEPFEIFPEYILLNINNFDNVSRNTLDEWIYFLKNSELPHKFHAKGLSEVSETLKYDKMDKVSKQQYDQYLKNMRISQDALDTALEKGLIKGRLQEKIDIVLNCLSNGIDIHLIANITNLSEEEVEKIIREHKDQI